MPHHIHKGFLYLDQHKRYCLRESGVPADRTLTCTRFLSAGSLAKPEMGCRARMIGDGEVTPLFATTGGKFQLVEHMKARYVE